jgi:RND superfamily putative drug exporter
MSNLARWCFRHRRLVVATWLIALIAALAASTAAGSRFNTSFSLPGTDSQRAVDLLKANFPSASGENDQIVIEATQGSVHSSNVRAAVSQMLEHVRQLPDVVKVVSPYDVGVKQTSGDAHVAFAVVTLDKQADDVTDAQARELIKVAKRIDQSDVRVDLAGQSISSSNRPQTGLSVIVGISAALVILLLVFGGAFLASLLPLATAGVALVLATSVIGLLTRLFTIPSISTELAVLVGLGVGVDYGLFVVSRHRSAVKEGLSYEAAAAQAVSTSGRTVLFAGITVCIALLGQFALGVSFLYGMSVSAALAVALTMASSLTFLPAMLGFVGPRVLSRRERRTLADEGPLPSQPSRFWLAWARFVERRALVVSLSGLGVVLLVALPILGLRLGSSDASTDPSNTTTSQAYNALARGFGPGFNGPFELAGKVTAPSDAAAFARLLAKAARTPGVASVTPQRLSSNGRVALATLYPTTGPQAAATASLVHELRDRLIPSSVHGTGLTVHVGGETATNIDFAAVLTAKLPVFVAVVVLLAFLLLMVVFRSLLISFVASIMNLLSIGAALGALNAVFHWGWCRSLLGLSATGPIDAFLPVLMFSVLFGLSMDYEVYLVGRMQEEWHGHRLLGPGLSAGAAHVERSFGRRRNHSAVTMGQARSGQVIAAAAAIMFLVFGSFLVGGQRAIKEFGFGLAFSVLIDAFVIRSLLVPGIMHLVGPRNWWLPGSLDRLLPRLSVEGEDRSIPTEAPIQRSDHGPQPVRVPDTEPTRWSQ